MVGARRRIHGPGKPQRGGPIIAPTTTPTDLSVLGLFIDHDGAVFGVPAARLEFDAILPYRSTSGCVVKRLREVQVNNPLFILEAIDKVGDADEDTDPLLGVLDSSNRTAFRDAYIDVQDSDGNYLHVPSARNGGKRAAPGCS